MIFTAILGAFAVLSGCAHWSDRPPALGPADFLAAPEMAEPVAPATMNARRLAAAIFHETNRVRLNLGLPAFQPLPQLDEAAVLQASYSALNLTSGHTQPFPHLAMPVDRVRSVGLNPGSVSENAAVLPLWHLAPGQSVTVEQRPEGKTMIDPNTGKPPVWHTYASFAAAVVQAWLDSPGHRENLLNRDSEFLGCGARSGRSITGIDVVAAVQVFYRPAGLRTR